MNSIERISATFKGQPTDRRAVCLTLPLFGARLTGCKVTEHYTDPVVYARGQTAVRETFEPDVLLGPFAFALEGAAFGGRLRFLDDAAPNLARPAITSAKEIDQITIPDVDSHPMLLYLRDSIRRISAEHGSEVPVAAIVSGPVDLPALILGMEGWLETILFDETGARRMLEITVPFFVRWVNALLDDGATFVVVPCVFANPSAVTRKAAIELFIPAVREAFAQLNGPVLLHSAGLPLAPHLDLINDLPNAPGFVLNGGESFAEARRKIGPDPVLLGNIEGPSLFLRDRDDIEADCLAVLNDRRDDPRFVLATSMADIALDTPMENIHVFREAVAAQAEEYAA
jgi:uroporphyrinogen decarboxylase